MDTIATHNPTVTSRIFDGEAVIIDTEANVVRMLNEVGSRIWELVDGERSVAEIAEVLVSEYDVSEEEASQSVVQFLSELETKGLLHYSSMPATSD